MTPEGSAMLELLCAISLMLLHALVVAYLWQTADWGPNDVNKPKWGKGKSR